MPVPQIGIFYGSTDGHTAEIAARLKEMLDDLNPLAEDGVELLDVAEYHLDALLDFECIVLGVPTWNTGQLQRDWHAALEDFTELDLSGRRVAIFGLGDQTAYPDTFADAMIFLADQVRACGAKLVGAWSTDGYAFRSSWSVEDGHFVGLVLDEHTQPELTETRLQQWSATLQKEFRHEHRIAAARRGQVRIQTRCPVGKRRQPGGLRARRLLSRAWRSRPACAPSTSSSSRPMSSTMCRSTSSALAALCYLTATIGFAYRRRWSWWLSVGALGFETAMTLVVGVLSFTQPDLIGRTVWRHFGEDYGFFPLFQPLLGLVWLFWPLTMENYGVRRKQSSGTT